LHGDPRHAQMAQKLAARLEALRRETGDHYVYTPTVTCDEGEPCAENPKLRREFEFDGYFCA
jgi:hypothetical protein